MIKSNIDNKTKSKPNRFALFKSFFSDRRRAVIVFAVIAFFIYFIFKQFAGASGKISYQTAPVENGTLVSSVSASGQVLTANIVSISTTATGVVNNVFVKDGDIVTTGQKIMQVTLDGSGQAKNTAAFSSYLAAQTSLDAANANAYSLRSVKDTSWNKFYNLAISSDFQNGDGSPRNDQRNSSAVFQSAQADWLSAEAKFKNQQAVIAQNQTAVQSAWLSYQQSSAIISAPVSGTVTNIIFVPGMDLTDQSTSVNTNVSQRVAVIKNDQTPIVSVNLSEVDVPKVKIGENVTLTADSITGKTFTGKVITVDKIGSVTSNVTNYPAVIKLDTGADQLLPNMAVTAKIITNIQSNVLLVPTTAIQNLNGQSAVRIIKNGQPQSIPVEVGDSNDTQTIITSGVSDGQNIITGQSNPAGSGSGSTTSPFSLGGGRGIGGGAIRRGN